MQNTIEKKIRNVTGRVVSDKMEKTRVVKIEMRWKHPVFKKSLLRSKRIKVHDEKNESRLGDLVSVTETRPLSRDKRHILFKVLEKSK